MDCRAKLGCHNIRPSKLSWQEIVIVLFLWSQLCVKYVFFCVFSTGTIYTSIFQSLIDVQNLLDLLSESPDIFDEHGTKIPFV